MVERRITRSRRKRRSSATLERLETARQRRVAQLEREREKERRVDAALGPFAEAVTAVEVAERRREDRIAAVEAQLARKLAELDRQRAVKVAECERLVEQVRADAEMEIAEWRSVMATSVAQIRGSDVGVADTAALLGISAKMVTALAREAARAVPADAAAGSAVVDHESVAMSGEASAAADFEAAVADGAAAMADGVAPDSPGEAG